MPLIESQPDALALTYARSLMGVVESKGGKEAALDTLGELEDILELARVNAKFGEFLSSRVLPLAKRRASIERMFKGRVNAMTLNFLLVLNRKDRLGHLPAIIGAFEQLVQEKFGRVEVDVFTAEALDADGVSKIRDRLGSALQKEVVLHPYVDGTMIGGVRIRMGDQLIDASVATQLRKMKDKLQSQGVSELKSRIGRIIGE